MNWKEKDREVEEEGDIEEEGEVSSIPWQSIQCDTDSAPPSLQFDEQTGHSLELPSHPEPVHFVSNFLDDSVLGHVVEETNR